MSENTSIPFGFSNGKETVEILRKYPELRKLPHGSGINADYYLYLLNDESSDVVIDGSYQVMNDVGMYIGWINFKTLYHPKTNTFEEVMVENDTLDESDEDLEFYIDSIKERLDEEFSYFEETVHQFISEKEIFQEFNGS